MRVLYTWASWLFLTDVWVTASLLKSPGLFSVFWPILVMLLSGGSLRFLLFLSSSVPLPICGEMLQSAPITISITFRFMLTSFLILKQEIFISAFAFCGLPRLQNPLIVRFSLLLLITWSVRQAEIQWSICISKSSEVCAFCFQERILDCAHSTRLYSLISISCTIPSGSPLPPQSSLVLYSLCPNFAAFAYYVIDHFVSFST